MFAILMRRLTGRGVLLLLGAGLVGTFLYALCVYWALPELAAKPAGLWRCLLIGALLSTMFMPPRCLAVSGSQKDVVAGVIEQALWKPLTLLFAIYALGEWL